MSLTHMQIKELLDENLKHQCEGYGPDTVMMRKMLPLCEGMSRMRKTFQYASILSA
jgi:hypothetical protein